MHTLHRVTYSKHVFMFIMKNTKNQPQQQQHHRPQPVPATPARRGESVFPEVAGGSPWDTAYLSGCS